MKFFPLFECMCVYIYIYIYIKWILTHNKVMTHETGIMSLSMTWYHHQLTWWSIHLFVFIELLDLYHNWHFLTWSRSVIGPKNPNRSIPWIEFFLRLTQSGSHLPAGRRPPAWSGTALSGATFSASRQTEFKKTQQVVAETSESTRRPTHIAFLKFVSFWVGLYLGLSCVCHQLD